MNNPAHKTNETADLSRLPHAEQITQLGGRLFTRMLGGLMLTICPPEASVAGLLRAGQRVSEKARWNLIDQQWQKTRGIVRDVIQHEKLPQDIKVALLTIDAFITNHGDLAKAEVAMLGAVEIPEGSNGAEIEEYVTKVAEYTAQQATEQSIKQAAPL